MRRNPARSLALTLLGVVILSSCRPPPTPTATPLAAPTATLAPLSTRQGQDPLPVTLPAADSPHPSYATEWWYYNGHVRTEAGEDYSFHYVVFDVRLPGIQPMNIYQVAVTDHQTEVCHQDQRSVGNAPIRQPSSGFRYSEGDWLIAGNGGADHLVASLSGYGFDISLKEAKPAALHGGIGYLDFSPTSKTYYYSRTRMDASGTMTVNGKPAKVTGTAWFDHQWGNFRPEQGGWDWFALQLDDGRDLMVTRLRDATGKQFFTYGTLVARDGTVLDLLPGADSLSATGTWSSPTSGGTYPMGWRLRVPEAALDVTLTPIVQNAEFDATKTTFNRYWEGPVTVSGNASGIGFVEMVGYAPVLLPGR